MLPQEEYLKRHRIAETEVHHTLQSGSLVLRVDTKNSDLPSRWVMVSLTWRDNPHHPGNYEIKIQTPVKDATSKKDLFQNVRGYPPNLSLQYEEIEDFFAEMATAHGKVTAISANPELALACWEIFLYTHDSYLAKSCSRKLRDAIETSIDFDLPVQERYYAYIDATNFLMSEHPPTFEKFETCIHIHIKRSLDWLARLVNGE
jgi:hypothetical protein